MNVRSLLIAFVFIAPLACSSGPEENLESSSSTRGDGATATSALPDPAASGGTTAGSVTGDPAVGSWPESQDASGDEWWGTGSDTIGMSAEEVSGEGEGDEDEEFFGWIGGGVVESGESYDEGWAEYIVRQGGEDRCLVYMEPVAARSVDTCDACDWAFEWTWSSAGTETAEGCREQGIDPDAFEGRPFGVGYASDRVLLRLDGSWTPGGEAFMEGKVFEYATPSPPY